MRAVMIGCVAYVMWLECTEDCLISYCMHFYPGVEVSYEICAAEGQMVKWSIFIYSKHSLHIHLQKITNSTLAISEII